MFCRLSRLQLALVGCMAAILIHYLINKKANKGPIPVLLLFKESLLGLGNVYALIFCNCRLYLGYGTGQSEQSDNVTEEYSQCQQPTFCILWKSQPSITKLSEIVEALPARVELFISDDSSLEKGLPHFVIHHHDQHLHFANVLQQEDGSWWFDAVHSEKAQLVLNPNQFYIGKYQGWLKNVSVARGAVLDVPSDWPALRRQLATSRYVPCDDRAAHQFHLTEGRDVSPEAERFRHRAWRLLAAAASALDELGVPFWLSSGTCLGYYRQCDFVPYMGDVDIGVRIASLQDFTGDQTLATVDQVITAMRARRLRLVHRFGRPSDSLELCFRSPDDIKLDVFFFYDDGGLMWNGGTQARTGLKFRYDFTAFTLCWTEFLELRVRVPCDTERYLRANYGPEWRTPRADWDWKTSPSNVRPNGVWSPLERDEVVQMIEP